MKTTQDGASVNLEQQDESALWRLAPDVAARWGMKKRLNQVAARSLIDYGADDRIRKMGTAMQTCGNSLHIREHVRGWSVAKAFLCHKRTCPICAELLAKARRMDCLRRVPPILAANPDCGKVPVLLTVTLRNCSVHEVRACIQKLNKAWRSLSHHQGVFGRWLCGFVKGIEVTRGADGSAHPHFHAACYVRKGYFSGNAPAVSIDQLREMVKRALGLDYLPVVHLGHKRGAGLDGAILEALKYCLKPSRELYESGRFFAALTSQMLGLRLVEAGGILRGIFRETFEGDELALDELDGMRDVGEETGRSVYAAWHVVSASAGWYQALSTVRQISPEEWAIINAANRAAAALPPSSP